MVRFAHPEFLYALAILPFVAVVFLWALRKRRAALARYGLPATLRHLMPEASRKKPALKFWLLASALGMVVLGAADPQIGTKLEEVKREGVDVIVALDVSKSMLAEDIKPNRLESAKQEISHLIDRLQNDRIGLVVFAGESYLQLPLTTDYGAARLLLAAVSPDIAPVPGTAIGSAIRMAMQSFAAGERKYKVLILITDGENHQDDAIATAREAAAEGVVIHAVGMGSPEGVPIPQGRDAEEFLKDNEGNTVVTKLDEQGLRQIAEAGGGGEYLRATNRQDELDAIFGHIQAMEKKEYGAKVFTEYEDRFQYLLGAAVAFVLLEFFISERKNKWLMRWKLFREEA